MKTTWCGQDVETLAREKLIEIMLDLNRQLEELRRENLERSKEYMYLLARQRCGPDC